MPRTVESIKAEIYDHAKTITVLQEQAAVETQQIRQLEAKIAQIEDKDGETEQTPST